MAVNPRPSAPALSFFAIAFLLALPIGAGAVPMPVEQGDRTAANGPAAALSNPHQATAVPLTVGTPAGGVTLANSAPVVEPGTLALVGLGLVIVGLTTSARSRARRGGAGKKR
ncbi:MAG: hypothetical protein AAFN78_09695 [Pseudomonadota bacterium]